MTNTVYLQKNDKNKAIATLIDSVVEVPIVHH